MRRVVRPVNSNEWDSAMNLVWNVFLRCNAPGCSKFGIDSFFQFLTDDILYKMFRLGNYRMFGCFDGSHIIGVISVRDRNHISLLFVDERYQHQRIGSTLMRYMCDYLLEYEGQTYITVDATPRAVDFYHKIGFSDTGREEEKMGIRYTPMRFFL